jgi:hypothetical protein
MPGKYVTHEDAISHGRAIKWLQDLYDEAKRKGDHGEQRMIEYIREAVWDDWDMRN